MNFEFLLNGQLIRVRTEVGDQQTARVLVEQQQAEQPMEAEESE